MIKEATCLDRLLFDCGYMEKFCRNNVSEANERLRVDCVDRLVQSGKFIDQISNEFRFEKAIQNGFVQFFKIATCFTDLVVNQIKTKNRIDSVTRKLFESVVFYADWLIETYKQLKCENKSTEDKRRDFLKNNNGQHFIRREPELRSRHFYELVNSDDDALGSKFTRHLGFWLPADTRRTLKMLNFVIALVCRPPWSLSALFGEKFFAKYIAIAYTNVDINFPFSLWHLSENPVLVNIMNYVVNYGLPVRSETVHVPRQKRYRLDCKGNLLDFDRMTKQQVADYFDDEDEQARQNSPGLRHRNKETIKCRYSYIVSREKIVESLERIKSKAKPKFKVLNYYTTRVHPDDLRVSEEINNNYEEGLEVKIDAPNDSRQQNGLLPEDFHPNPECVLLLVIHGGGLLTQGPTSCETYLRKIVNELGGVNCLAIDYSLTVPYPIPLQEILDVYLWALSGRPDVKETLGFHPKRVVLSGDSCGGFFSIALTIVLNELIKMRTKPNGLLNGQLNGYANGHSNGLRDLDPLPSLPMSVVAAYPAFSISNLAPSKTLFTFEPLVEIHMFMLIMSVYGANLSTLGDFKRIENSEAFQRIAAKNKDKFTNVDRPMYSSPADDSIPWFKCDYPTFVNYADYIDSFYNHPFINPVLYGDRFGELKDVSLFTFVGTADFLMDDSIELARVWKGKTCLDLFENAVHGFLSLSLVSGEAREASEVVIERYREACGLI